MKKGVLLALLFLMGCVREIPDLPPKLTVINIIDNNGMSETISAPERLKQYEGGDFLSCQPYKKVMRVYARDPLGNVPANIASYHPNGQPWQYLEVSNGRASGTYKEWYLSGALKIEAHVIGGDADLTVNAEKTWLFEGLNKVWDEQGHLLASFLYCKGYLEGLSTYYHPCGSIWKTITYYQGKREGKQQIFREDGGLLSEMSFKDDELDGPSTKYWSEGTFAADELYCRGELISGSYWDRHGRLVTQICHGQGKRTLFGKDTVCEIQEYHNGVLEGKIELYSASEKLTSTFMIKEGLKHGEELLFFPNTSNPKLSISWYKGKVQGPVKSWYATGQIESQREMSDNKKNGLLTAWYKDGSLMMIEEYDHDQLLRGEYYRQGESRPLSEVIAGKGAANLFDPDGQFLKKVTYVNGRPDL